MDREAWNALAKHGSWFHTTPWLRCVEDAPPENMTFRYGIVWEEHRPVAAFRAQLITIGWEHLDLTHETGKPVSPIQRFTMHARNLALGAFGRRVLVCGDQFATGPYGLIVSPEADTPALRQHIMETILELRWEDGRRADYFVLEDWPGHTPPPLPLRDYSLGRLPTEPGMTLQIDPAWQAYDDYLHALKAKYRKAARTIEKDVTTAGAELVEIEDPASRAEELHALYAQVEARAVVRFGRLPADHLPALAAALGSENFHCIGLRWKGTLVGFGTLIRDGETAVAHIVGFDYAANQELPVYLRLLHALLETAIAWRCRELSLGRTALEPKSRMGAEPLPLDVYVRHRNPLVNQIAQRLLHLIPQATAPARRPFKT
jgi:hypothetical protein